MNIYSFLLILSNFAILINCQTRRNEDKYYGRYIGKFPGTAHGVKGEVYAVDENTIYIREFSYDGAGPAAFFWAGSTSEPNINGFIIPDELGRVIKLGAYDKQNIMLTLPKDKTLRDIKWIAVWCQLFTVNFGHVNIPVNFAFPEEKNLGPIPTRAHKTRADAVIVKDAKTIFIKNLHYDGAAPDAFFLMGTGNKPHEFGTKIPDENGSLSKIRGYRGQDISLRLPDNYTIFDFDWFGLFCITYRENFGHVSIPKNLNIPPDLKTLASHVSSFSNCETIFPDLLQVSWEVRHPDIYFQLEGRVAPDQYMSFGLSGSTERAQMVGSDVVIAFYDSVSQKAKVVDYTLTAKAQCAPQSKSGACPDEMVGGKEDVQLILWNYNEGVLKVSYKRKLYTRDDAADEEIIVTNTMLVVAAIGPLNSKKEAAFHTIKYTKASDKPIKILFGRLQNERNCDLIANPSHANPYSAFKPWKQSVIHAKNNQAFRVLIGPAGAERGYTPITGVQSWGIAYWVDDMLIPEIHVKRGHNYTFIVEAGDNPANQAKYHPLYITNNREGGGGQRIEDLNTPSHMVYAGVDFNKNRPDPSPGAGRYCELTINGIDKANVSNSVEQYRRTLTLVCEPGNVASFTWSPDENTPDVVYYQCFTHRNLGWKIIVGNYSKKLASFQFIHLLVLVLTIKLVIY